MFKKGLHTSMLLNFLTNSRNSLSVLDSAMYLTHKWPVMISHGHSSHSFSCWCCLALNMCSATIQALPSGHGDTPEHLYKPTVAVLPGCPLHSPVGDVFHIGNSILNPTLFCAEDDAVKIGIDD